MFLFLLAALYQVCRAVFATLTVPLWKPELNAGLLAEWRFPFNKLMASIRPGVQFLYRDLLISASLEE